MQSKCELNKRFVYKITIHSRKYRKTTCSVQKWTKQKQKLEEMMLKIEIQKMHATGSQNRLAVSKKPRALSKGP